MAEYVFLNISDNHFKVWGYDAFQGDDGTGESITYWGRIGVPMHKLQKRRKSFASYIDTHKYVMAKIEEKLYSHDYKAFPNSMYFQMIQSPRGIAALIDKIAKMGELKYYQRKLYRRKGA